jgi:hypothetical protein
MKHYLNVRRVSFGTGVKLRPVFRDLLQKAMTQHDVDIALCALVEFVRLEMGEEPDPEYQSFRRPEKKWDAFNDENWPDEEGFFPPSPLEDFGTSELHMLRYFDGWNGVINDPVEFDDAFPGMGDRRSNLALAMRPIFDLDPIMDLHVLELCLGWIKPLMKGRFEETRRDKESKELVRAA